MYSIFKYKNYKMLFEGDLNNFIYINPKTKYRRFYFNKNFLKKENNYNLRPAMFALEGDNYVFFFSKTRAEFIRIEAFDNYESANLFYEITD